MSPEQAFSQLVRKVCCLHEFKSYFPSAKDSQTAKEWMRNPFAFKPGEWTVELSA